MLDKTTLVRWNSRTTNISFRRARR